MRLLAALGTILAAVQLTQAWQEDLVPLRTLPLGEYILTASSIPVAVHLFKYAFLHAVFNFCQY